MAQNTASGYERTDSHTIEMAEHFLAFQTEYRTEPQHHEVVHEDKDCIVVADHTGHELSEWANDFDVDRSAFSARMHELAREVCDYNWATSDPVVFDKFVDRREEYEFEEGK